MAARACLGEPTGKVVGQPVGPLAGSDDRAQHPDHVEDASDGSLIEGVDGDATADQLGDDVGLQIGERQNQIRFKRQDLGDIGRGEGADPRLFATRLRRAHDIAGDPDDAVLLAEQI